MANNPAAYFEEAKSRDDLEILTDMRPLPFDDSVLLPAVNEVGEPVGGK